MKESEIQSEYWEWKRSQGQPWQGIDVTHVDNRIIPLTPTEEALYFASGCVALSEWQSEVEDEQ